MKVKGNGTAPLGVVFEVFVPHWDARKATLGPDATYPVSVGADGSFEVPDEGAEDIVPWLIRTGFVDDDQASRAEETRPEPAKLAEQGSDEGGAQ